MNTHPRRNIRWWPALGLLGVGALGLIWIWFGRLDRWTTDSLSSMLTAPVLSMFLAMFVGAGLVLWWLFASRVPLRLRAIGFVLLLLMLFVITQLVRVQGLSGDFAPQLAWRWTPDPGDGAATHARQSGGVSSEATAHDFPQLLGPDRDGRIHNLRLGEDWVNDPPRLLWKIPVGNAWSGFAVVGDHAVTQEQRDDEEWVTAYDLRSGELIWSHADTTRYDEPISGPGPRATPAIAEGRVLTVGASGLLNALDLAPGRLLWSRHPVQELEARVPEYGVSASPLIHGDAVIVSVGARDGASLVAYALDSGQLLWHGGNGRPGYSSPTAVTLAGHEQIVIFNDDYVGGHSPDDGTLLWSFAWPGETQNVSQPVVLGDDRLFVSSGYGIGGKLLRLQPNAESFDVELLWESRGLKAKFTNVVQHDGYLYGLDDGILVCLDASDGTRRWKRGRHGHGQILLIQDQLLVLGERGRVVLVRATPESYQELGSFEAVSGKAWNHIALAGDRLLVRTDREAACWELPRSDIDETVATLRPFGIR